MTGERHPIRTRMAQGDDDYWAVHRLLVETVPLTRPGFNWDIRRWEGRRFYDARPGGNPEWSERCRLWETADGQIVGAAFSEGRSSIALQVHPDYRHLETEMIAWSEENLGGLVDDGPQQQVHVFAYDYDSFRLNLLDDRGYEETPYTGVVRRLLLKEANPPAIAVAPGYAMRITNPDDPDDCQRIADLLNAAFERDFHNAEEYQQFTRQAPSFRTDLDLVAVAPDGSFAAYVGVPTDEVNGRGIFEPVCTHPAHRQKGLAQSLMFEGLQRLMALGAVDVTVETGDGVPANKLYDSIGFTEIHHGVYWRKVL